jgi:ABC-type spermidine/putrescine transport system permease subunit II
MQMFVGLREHLDPTITAAATLMMSLSVLLFMVANWLAGRRGN